MKQLAVFGHPVGHSRSPDIHQAFAHQAGIELTYRKIEAPLDDFVGEVKRFVRDGGNGFNVTVPFKVEAYELADRLDESARQSGTVNTMMVEQDMLCGANTDGTGLVRDLRDNLKWEPAGRRILIIGAGGAVAGVLPALLAEEPLRVDILNRTHAKAEALAARFDVNAVTPASADLAYDIVISGSAAGLSGEQMTLPESMIGPATNAYDMIYGTGITAFSRWALDAGAAAACDGLGMLVEQAAAAFSLWFDFEPKTRPVISRVRQSLGD